MQYLKITANHYFDSDVFGERKIQELHQVANSVFNATRSVHGKNIYTDSWQGEEYSDGYFSTSIYLQLPAHIKFSEDDLESLDELIQPEHLALHDLNIVGIETHMESDDVLAITTRIPAAITPIALDPNLFSNWDSD